MKGEGKEKGVSKQSITGANPVKARLESVRHGAEANSGWKREKSIRGKMATGDTSTKKKQPKKRLEVPTDPHTTGPGARKGQRCGRGNKKTASPVQKGAKLR